MSIAAIRIVIISKQTICFGATTLDKNLKPHLQLVQYVQYREHSSLIIELYAKGANGLERPKSETRSSVFTEHSRKEVLQPVWLQTVSGEYRSEAFSTYEVQYRT